MLEFVDLAKIMMLGVVQWQAGAQGGTESFEGHGPAPCRLPAKPQDSMDCLVLLTHLFPDAVTKSQCHPVPLATAFQ